MLCDIVKFFHAADDVMMEDKAPCGRKRYHIRSERRSRHRNTATCCISNQRRHLAAAAAVCCSPNQLLRSIMYMLLYCWDSSRRGSATCWYCSGLFSRCHPPPKNYQRSFFLYYSDLCPRSRGCTVLTHIDPSVSARHHTTRVLVCSRRLLHVPCAA